MYENIPKNEKSFDLTVIGATTGIEYTGRFKAMCVLNITGIHQLELEKTRMMADYQNPTTGLAGVAISIATIRAKLLEWPAWWDDCGRGEGVLDENLITELYTKLIQIESDWKKDLKLKAEAAREAAQKPSEGDA